MSDGRKFDKRKAFGQHFLTDIKVISNIVDQTLNLLTESEAKTLLEIGPGRGALTRTLLDQLPREISYHVAEIDFELIALWKKESRISSVIEGDFSNNVASVIENLKKFVVVSNLPYSSGTRIVVNLCDYPKNIFGMILMFQKEVADRIMAKPSTKERGSISVFIQNEWECESLLLVQPSAFKPAPKVKSKVIVLKPRKNPQISLKNAAEKTAWEELLRLSFSHRRKTLINNLKQVPQWKQALEKSGLAPTLRAEALDFEQWRKLWHAHYSA